MVAYVPLRHQPVLSGSGTMHELVQLSRKQSYVKAKL